MKKVPHDWQGLTAGNAAILLRCLLKTIRLASGPVEIAGVLRLFAKTLWWRLGGSPDSERDQVLRLRGVTHVVGLGTGELLVPQEIYWDRGYDRLPEFVPQPGWIVVDVGANTGVYAVQQARRGARVYAFEPNPECYRRLRKAMSANRVESQVVAVNRALGAATGRAALLIPEGLTTMGSLRPEWTAGAGTPGLEVEVDTVDRAVSALGIERIDLLKVDVEGLELDVLEGARETLARVERLVLEYHSVELGRRVEELLAAHALATVLDQRLYRGDESQYRGVGRGLLFARRQSVSGRPARNEAVA